MWSQIFCKLLDSFSHFLAGGQLPKLTPPPFFVTNCWSVWLCFCVVLYVTPVVQEDDISSHCALDVNGCDDNKTCDDVSEPVLIPLLQHQKSSQWCQEHFLNYKGLVRATTVREQLRRLLNKFKVPWTSSEGLICIILHAILIPEDVIVLFSVTRWWHSC